MTFLKLFNAGSFHDSYGLKETGTKWWFLKLLNTFEKSHQTVIHILKIWPFIFATYPQLKIGTCRIMETLLYASLITQQRIRAPEQDRVSYCWLKCSDMMGTKTRTRRTKRDPDKPVSRKERWKNHCHWSEWKDSSTLMEVRWRTCLCLPLWTKRHGCKPADRPGKCQNPT